MSHNNEANQSKESEQKINLSSNNVDEFLLKDDKNINNRLNNIKESEKKDFKNITNSQRSLDILGKERYEKSENQNNMINKNINNFNNFTEEEEENNNIINNNYEEDDENEEINLEQENINKIKNENYDNDNNDDEELPLITLNFISICQCCKNSFDNKTYLPYLLKCGHFFCIKCIKEYFSDKNGIKCPSDGLIAKSINELRLLSNLIPKIDQITINNDLPSNEINSNIENNNNRKLLEHKNNNFVNHSIFCPVHKEQKLSHVISNTNEIICVYCAFECFKKNPKCEIKELTSQLKEFTLNINDIISDNQNEVLKLHDSLKKIKSNKENEEKSINNFFDCLFDYLNEKKNDYLEQINNLFIKNTKTLGDKLEEINDNIENSEKLKNIIENFIENRVDENKFKENYNEILNKYLMIEQNNKVNNKKIFLDEYKFVHIDEDKLVKNCQALGEIKITKKKNQLNFNGEINDNDNYKESNLSKLILNKTNNNDIEFKSIDIGKEDNNGSNINYDIKKEDKKGKNLYKSIEAKYNKDKIQLNYHKNKNINYIVLDDLSINNNNNSFLNNDRNSLKIEFNNGYDNNFYMNNNGNKNKEYNIFNKKNTHNILRNNTFNSNSLKDKKVIIHKNSKSFYNYIEFPNYNTSYNNYYLLSKINNKKDKERNITVNNYEVHQTLKNSFNNNYNYGYNNNSSNYLNKLFEFNNPNSFGYNTNTNKNVKTNRKKFSFLGGLNIGTKNNNKKFDFK